MRSRFVLLLLCLGLLTSTAAQAQSPLSGVIDIHAHSDPDTRPRSIDAIDLARLAKERGMRGLVLKNHYESTAALAYVVRKVVPGIEIFGGIDLNRSVGGINPEAVERMVLLRGGWDRGIWMPTPESRNWLSAANAGSQMTRPHPHYRNNMRRAAARLVLATDAT